ncbi:MAG: class I SAM-dependent methyltransferase [Bacteroidales bacterium]|nr:class I SAM-dependent methyltransferase [Bacteroidales bacterium]
MNWVTSVGIGTLYLASNTSTEVVTVEGDITISEVAKKTFTHFKYNNIHIINNTFEHSLPGLLQSASGKRSLVYIDGNHRKKFVLHYFNEFFKVIAENSVIIIDDIRWSKEMKEAWSEIKNNDQISITVDLFFMGIVFLRKNVPKQNYLIRF